MTTVFHQGELFIQTESGIQERAHKFGNKLIRDHIIDQHKEFFEGLSYVFIALQDSEGRPWLSVMQGVSGFINSPDPKTLVLSGKPMGVDLLGLQIDPQKPVGIVGLDLSTRRRNRLNGNIRSSHDNVLSIDVGHSFGNCPKYIQLRHFEPGSKDIKEGSNNDSEIEHFVEFSDADIDLIRQSDTLFIASADKKDGDLDATHRGGKPGFVRVDNKTQLWFDDYPGNNFYQTFGNIHRYSTVGLLFLDFESGDLLLISGKARLENLDNAKDNKLKNSKFLARRFNFTLEKGLRLKGAVEGRWSFEEMSPFLNKIVD